MRTRGLWWVGVCLGITGPGAAQAATDLRVLVFPHILKYVDPQGRERDLQKVTLKSSGECTAVDPNGVVSAQGPLLEFKYSSFPSPLKVTCTAPATVVREVPLRSFTYVGTFRIQKNADTSLPPHLQVINDLSLEDYLTGVLPGEMPQSWPLETLKAQAVAARTYALWELAAATAQRPPGTRADLGYDFDDTVQYQAYVGATETPLPATLQALSQTAGQVLVTSDGLPIRAYFHADSGGHTEDAGNAIPVIAAPYCVGKPELYDPAGAPAAWTKKLSTAELTTLLRKGGLIGPDAVVRFLDVDEASRLASGRAFQVYVTLTNGERLAINALQLRFAAALRSTLFRARQDGDSLVFEGRGWGHGVGMSQWGAKLLNDQFGWDYARILGFYYTGVTLITQ